MTDAWVGKEEFGLRLPRPQSSKFFQCRPERGGTQAAETSHPKDLEWTALTSKYNIAMVTCNSNIIYIHS